MLRSRDVVIRADEAIRDELRRRAKEERRTMVEVLRGLLGLVDVQQ